MKHRVAKILLALYLFSFTPLKEVVRLPILVAHYFQHQNEGDPLSIVNFFKLHYAEGIVFDDDYEQDMQLPFKNIQDLCSSSLYVGNQHVEFPVKKVTFPSISEKTLMVPPFYCLTHQAIGSIFHPPRLLC